MAIIYPAMALAGAAMIAWIWLHGGRLYIAFGGGALIAIAVYLTWTDFFSSERL